MTASKESLRASDQGRFRCIDGRIDVEEQWEESNQQLRWRMCDGKQPIRYKDAQRKRKIPRLTSECIQSEFNSR